MIALNHEENYTITITLLLFCEVFPSKSQENIHKYRFEHITVNDGLPHSDANCIVSDSTGIFGRYQQWCLKIRWLFAQKL
jgi:hypothetical protein